MKTAKKLMAVLMCTAMLISAMCVGADAIVGIFIPRAPTRSPGMKNAITAMKRRSAPCTLC